MTCVLGILRSDPEPVVVRSRSVLAGLRQRLVSLEKRRPRQPGLKAFIALPPIVKSRCQVDIAHKLRRKPAASRKLSGMANHPGCMSGERLRRSERTVIGFIRLFASWL